MERSINKSVGKRIRVARRDTGLTLEYVADKLGITPSALGHIERGRNLISLEHLVKLPAILGCKITALLPDSVVTDYDRERAADPKLREIQDRWNSLPEYVQESIVFLARGAEEKGE